MTKKQDLINKIDKYFNTEIKENRDIEDLYAQIEEANELLQEAREFINVEDDICVYCKAGDNRHNCISCKGSGYNN